MNHLYTLNKLVLMQTSTKSPDLNTPWHIYTSLDINTSSVRNVQLYITQLRIFPWITHFWYHLTMRDTAPLTRS